MKEDPGIFASPKKRNQWLEQRQRERLKTLDKKRRRRDAEPVTVLQEGTHGRFATKSQRRFVFERDNHECQYCGRTLTMRTMNVDHVIPYKYGGLTELNNLVASCRPCNHAKGNQPWSPVVRVGRAIALPNYT